VNMTCWGRCADSGDLQARALFLNVSGCLQESCGVALALGRLESVQRCAAEECPEDWAACWDDGAEGEGEGETPCEVEVRTHPGAEAAGEPCASEADCETGVCVQAISDGGDEVLFCSRFCSKGIQCQFAEGWSCDATALLADGRQTCACAP